MFLKEREKIMFILQNEKSIETRANAQIKVEKAKMKAFEQLTDIELQKLRLEKDLMPKQDEIDRMKFNVRGRKMLQKTAWTYRICANALSLTSALMTISGIAGTDSLFSIYSAFTGKTGVFAVTTALLQMSVINLNKRSFEIKQHHFIDYKQIAKFKAIVISISMVGNFQYMNGIMPHSTFYMCVSAAVAVSLDFGSMWLSNLATNVKYRNYTSDTEKGVNMSRADKLLRLVSYCLLGWIDKKYDEKFEGNPGTQQEAVKADEKTKLTTDKQRDYEYMSIVEKIKKMPDGTVVSKDTFGLNTYQWKLCRGDLEKDKLIYCDKKKSFVSKNLVEQAKEKL